LRRLWSGGPYTKSYAQEALHLAQAALIRTGVSPFEIQAVSETAEVWPTLNGCSDLPPTDAGYRVLLSAEGQTYDYRVHVPGEATLCTRLSAPPDPFRNLLAVPPNAVFPGDPRLAVAAGRADVLGQGPIVAGVDLRNARVHYSRFAVPNLIGLRVAAVGRSHVVIGTSRLRLANVRTGRWHVLDRRVDFVVAGIRVLTFGGFRGVVVHEIDSKKRVTLLRHRYVDRGAAQGRYAYVRRYLTRRWCVIDAPRTRILACRFLPANTRLLAGRSGVRTSESP
jgi:hypothetical protein